VSSEAFFWCRTCAHAHRKTRSILMCTKRLTLYMLHRSLRWRGSSRHIRNGLRNVLGCMNMPHTGTCRSLYTSDCRSPVSEQSPASSSLSAASCMSVYLLRRRISWHETVTNKEVLRTVKEDRQMLNSIRQRKHRWIGNVLRHDGLLHEITEGRMKGKPTRGRRRIQMLHDLANDGGFVALTEGWRYKGCQ